ncbi:hypothetical protein [Enterobacter hormaechei]|uniref:hypothetical protein n=1 Tax=Enterobacter hormaechei TaxID=158836 RepID=UPI001BDFC79C|nr:hypothetical protein [Enterobacter hormaechei subsp. xiangfangensis]HAV1851625.1 hypothetical protein [Enterobacter hormaechei subsp. xiangfangensis]
MSVKTEAKKPAAEISLFDAFGPDVSEQVQAINLRAAELSMDDMARVMCVADRSIEKNVKVGALCTAEFPEIAPPLIEHGEETLRQLEGIRSGYYGLPDHNDHLVQPEGLNIHPTRIAPLWLSHASKATSKIQDAIESASSNMRRLLDIGVDERTMVIAIKYSDPQTGVQRTLTLDDEVTSGSRSTVRVVTGNRLRFKKTRRSVRETPFMAVTSKK